MWLTHRILGLYLSRAWKPFNKPWEDTGNSPTVSLHPPPLSYTSLLFSSVNKPQNFTSPALNGAHQAISEPYLTRAWKSLTPLSSLRTSLFSHEMTPLFNQLWIMKFCTRDPFSLHLTVIELHSHAIPFTTAMRRKESEGGAAHWAVCVYVCVCVCERWRWFPCDIMGPCSVAPQQRVPSVHWGHVVRPHSGILQLIYRGAKEVRVCVYAPQRNSPSHKHFTEALKNTRG